MRGQPGLRRASFWTRRRANGSTARSTQFAGAVAPGGAGMGDWIRPLWNQPRTIQLAPFTAAVFRAGVFERVGFLDERFESYLEDVDFGLRCAEAGLGGLYVPEAVAYHQGSATLGRWHRGHGAEDRPQSVTPGGETLSAELGLTLWLASLRRSGFMGNRRAPARCAVKLSSQAKWKVCGSFARPGESTAPALPRSTTFPAIASNKARRKSAKFSN